MNFIYIKNQIFKILFNIFAIIYFIFDEIFVFISDKLNILFSQFELFNDFSYILKNSNKNIILVLFLFLLVVSELIGILSFTFLVNGEFYFFLVFYIIKIFPFFLVSFIFKQTKEIILQIKLFNFLFSNVMKSVDLLKNTEIITYVKKYKK